MNLEKLIYGFIFVALTSASAQAEVCSDKNATWNGTRCVTTGASVAAGTASGIYAMKKYSQVNSIEKEHNKRIFDGRADAKSTDQTAVARATAGVGEGDRVTINYQLSEAENRAHHISILEDREATARQNAASHTLQSMTASKPVYSEHAVRKENGEVEIRRTLVGTEPDWAARHQYAAMALQENSNANNYANQAADARRGGPVPTYTFDKVVKGEKGTAKVTGDFATEKIASGGKVLTIDKLPAAQYKIVKSVLLHGRGGIAGAVIGAGAAIEEAVAGKVAEKIRGRSNGSGIEMRQPRAWQ